MRRTDEELKQLAKDLVAGHVFTSLSLPANQAHLVSVIFLPLALLSPKQREELAKQDPVMFFEYIQHALPRAINGYPTFASVQQMDQQDLDRLREYVVKVKKALDSV